MNSTAASLSASRTASRKAASSWPAIAFAATVLLAAVYAFSPRPVPSFAPTAVHPGDLLVTSLVRHQQHILAAGEQGRILMANDAAGPWHEAKVTPQRGSTLTQLLFISDKVALAVGHDAWILRSDDGGESWKEAFYVESPKDAPLPPVSDGAMAPPADAGFNGPPDEGSAVAGAAPLQPDPLLGVAGPYDGHLFAFGAFGLLLTSTDEGRSWTRVQSEQLGDHHLNGMLRAGDHSLLLVGERGLLARSTDNGANWKQLPSIYTGSFFGAMTLPSQALLVYGMRGNVFRSDDSGKSWHKSEVPGSASLFAGNLDAQGHIVLVGSGSSVLVSDDDGRSFKAVTDGGRHDFAAVLPIDAKHWLTAGDGGIALETASSGSDDAAGKKTP